MWRRIQKSFATPVPIFILLVYITVIVCLLNRWDSMVAVSLIPFWAWAAVGMLACLLSWILFRGVLSIVVLCLWLGTSLFLSEEARGLVRELGRSIDPKSTPQAEILRVVNLDANGSTESFVGLIDLKPGIVILQNAPRESEVQSLLGKLYGMDGDFLAGKRNAIIAKGEFIDTIEDPEGNAVHARLRLENGFLIDITGLELTPCLPSSKLWKPATWRRLTELRMQNRRQLRNFLGENQITRPNTARIVAGGFNTPPGDDVFRPLESSSMKDAFDVAGVGWGNTFPSDYPFLRLDQIWLSENLIPLKTSTEINATSEHRTVVTDLQITVAEE